MMVVIVDIDDVLMPWAEQVHLACVEAGLNPNNRDWTRWEMWEDYGCTLEEWRDVVNSLVVHNGIYHSPPYPGAVEALRRLENEGHQIHLVTARGFHDHAEQIRTWTKDWIRTFDVPGQLWFAKNKGEIAQKLDATHGIDDRFENYVDLVNVGVQTYLKNQPHNASAPVSEFGRVDSIAEFVDKILQDSA